MKRSRKVSFDTKLILNVAGAALIVNNVPKLLGSILPLDGVIQKVAGVGVAYVAGMVMKNPTLSNAAIAVGAVDLVQPMIDDLLGTGTPNLPSGAPLPIKKIQPSGMKTIQPASQMADYVSLNGLGAYVNAPGRANQFGSYRETYQLN